ILASIQAGLHPLSRREPGFYVTTVYGLRHKVMGTRALEHARIELKVGDTLDTDTFGERLAAMGYRPAGVVELPGDMAVRGGLIDVFSPSTSLPLRIELFGDQIESIRTFEPLDQRSREVLERAL